MLDKSIKFLKKINVIPKEIVCLQADESYTKIFLDDGKTYIVAKTLKKLEGEFTHLHFIRPHKSHLINLAQIEFIIKKNSNINIQMSNKMKIGVSRRRRKPFLDLMKDKQILITET